MAGDRERADERMGLVRKVRESLEVYPLVAAVKFVIAEGRGGRGMAAGAPALGRARRAERP